MVALVTYRQENGWKGQADVTSAFVPPQSLLREAQMSRQPKLLDCGTPVPLSPGKPQMSQEEDADPTAAPKTPHPQPDRAQGPFSMSRTVYKGSTPDARGLHKLQPGEHPLSASLVIPFYTLLALARLGEVGMARIGA
jgi:hypothetical protein